MNILQAWKMGAFGIPAVPSESVNFYSVGTSNTSTSNAGTFYSLDGQNWNITHISDWPSGSQLSAQRGAYNGSYYLRTGRNGIYGAIFKSTDGINWTLNDSSVITSNTYALNNVAWNGSYWLAVGGNPTGGTCILRSTDGDTWELINNSYAYELDTVSWNGSYWLVGGRGTDGGRIYTSSNGTDWTDRGNATFVGEGATIGAGPRASCWDGAYWVIGGYRVSSSNSALATMAYSSDGINWIRINSSVIDANYYINSICWDGNHLVVGAHGSNTIVYSTNRTTWSAVTTGDNSIHSVVWDGTHFYATGTLRIIRSSDIINWTQVWNGGNQTAHSIISKKQPNMYPPLS